MTEQVTHFAFISSAAPQDDPLSVVEFHGNESLSCPFEFSIELKSRSDKVDVDALLGQAASLHMQVGGKRRAIHGELTEFDVIGERGDFTLYRTTLVPRVWRLSQYRSNEVHVDETLPEIITSVLEDSGFTALDYELRLERDYPQWPMCCQFDETHLDFISRLMEREGLYYFFEHDNDIDRLIICDHLQGQVELEEPALVFQAPTGMEVVSFPDTVHSLVCKQRRLPRRVLIKDYNDENPSVNIHGEAEVDPGGVGEIYDYGGHVASPDIGHILARISAEQLLSQKRRYHGEGAVGRLQPGFVVHLEGHFRAGMNQSYQVLSIDHEGREPSLMTGETTERNAYTNTFTLMEADVQFRPEKVTAKPRFYGTMNAFIDSETDGEYAQVDSTGRYKVVLPFDRVKRKDAKASCWIRMAQPYAGEGEGMHFPLRKNAEVLLTFIGGDPDRPVISGAVPNHGTPSVVVDNNQTRNVIQTSKGNRLEMEDRNHCRRIKLFSPHKNSYMHLGAPDQEGDGWVVVTEGMERKEILGGQKLTIMAGDGEGQTEEDADRAKKAGIPAGQPVLLTGIVTPGDGGMQGRWTYRSRNGLSSVGGVSDDQGLYLNSGCKLMFEPQTVFNGERKIEYITVPEPSGSNGSEVRLALHAFNSNSENVIWNPGADRQADDEGIEFDEDEGAYRVTAPWIAVTKVSLPPPEDPPREIRWSQGAGVTLQTDDLDADKGILLKKGALIRLDGADQYSGTGRAELRYRVHAAPGDKVAAPTKRLAEKETETLVFHAEENVTERELFAFDKRNPVDGSSEGNMEPGDEFSGRFLIERRKGDQYYWGVGRHYNHGHWPSYNVGTAYVENHASDVSTKSSSAGLNREPSFDLLDKGGPAFGFKDQLGGQKLDDEFRADAITDGVDTKTLWVTKDFQDDYFYRSGARIAVDEDVSDLTIKKGGKRVLIEYDEEGNKTHWIGSSGEEKKWDSDGNLLFHSRDASDDKSVVTEWKVIGGLPRKVSETTEENGETTSQTWSPRTGNNLSKTVTSEDAGGRKTESTVWDPLNKAITSFHSGNSGHGEQFFKTTMTAQMSLTMAFDIKEDYALDMSASRRHAIVLGASQDRSVNVSFSDKAAVNIGVSSETSIGLAMNSKLEVGAALVMETTAIAGLKLESNLVVGGVVKTGFKAIEIDVQDDTLKFEASASKGTMTLTIPGIKIEKAGEVYTITIGPMEIKL